MTGKVRKTIVVIVAEIEAPKHCGVPMRLVTSHGEWDAFQCPACGHVSYTNREDIWEKPQ